MLRGSIRKLTVESIGMQLGVSGGSLIGGHERRGDMLDRLEHLLPIPIGAKMDRWRKMVIQRIERKKWWSKRRGERQKCTRDIFVHRVHREWVTWCFLRPYHWNQICWEQVCSVTLLFNPSCVLSSQTARKVHNSFIISSGSISISAITKSSAAI